jgi:hypothetical protein
MEQEQSITDTEPEANCYKKVVKLKIRLACPIIGRQQEDMMKTRYTVALSMLAGAALAVGVMQGLHAQATRQTMGGTYES